jgi:hypothetical protein
MYHFCADRLPSGVRRFLIFSHGSLLSVPESARPGFVFSSCGALAQVPLAGDFPIASFCLCPLPKLCSGPVVSFWSEVVPLLRFLFVLFYWVRASMVSVQVSPRFHF